MDIGQWTESFILDFAFPAQDVAKATWLCMCMYACVWVKWSIKYILKYKNAVFDCKIPYKDEQIFAFYIYFVLIYQFLSFVNPIRNEYIY